MSRRCKWCTRRLRFWQRGYCRICADALAMDAPSGPPQGQYFGEPDRLVPSLKHRRVS